MPERESASPQHDPDARLGDLFENLPDPAPQIPVVEDSRPAPGSRRAAREAAAAAGAAPQSAAAPQPSASAQPAAADAAAQDASSARREMVEQQASPEQAPATETSPAGHPAPVSATQASDAAEPAPVRTDAAVSPRSEDGDSPAEPVSRPAIGGGLDDLFHDDHEDHPRAPKKKRRTGCLVALVIVLALLGGLAAGGAWVWNTYGDKISDAMGWGDPKDWEPGLATGEAMVTISEGDTGQPVSQALFDAGVTRTEDVFYDYLVEENVSATFYPGVYRLQKKMTAAAALEALQNPENKLENTVSVAEGGTISSILPSIAETMEFPIEELQAAVADPSVYGVAAQSLEGWLFPAVYTFDPGVTATQVIQKMVDRTRESLASAGVPDADAERILTIASIIQREGRTDDFDKVSRVIQNRLDIDMKLQMDSTAQYGYGSLHEGVVSSSKEALEDPNPWNTYVNTGLPVTPIASASDAAINAAMHPADGPWLYFVTVNLETGETVFSTTYEEHQAAIEQWDAWCKANPDGGCS
ncbi:putative aminodeoxychorismate lyase [Microbacterium hydrocarbonoxydans]|uniref:Endolytic murein transglycosylase n=1 Tax=Microbacterium hydrocarbonoxydans TaxID=273678 RepID=A0A0M2HN25_9MICO|nr:endolytic transglycosylase MltG [Microbacterium hydrocarbonoxydans]KJL46328.1 putative aminodeoxychorismate lyase [Microbacterium hydrocarbonoxydans]